MYCSFYILRTTVGHINNNIYILHAIYNSIKPANSTQSDSDKEIYNYIRLCS